MIHPSFPPHYVTSPSPPKWSYDTIKPQKVCTCAKHFTKKYQMLKLAFVQDKFLADLLIKN